MTQNTTAEPAPQAVHQQLARAEMEVQRQAVQNDRDTMVESCRGLRHRIEVEVFDDVGEPVAELCVELRHAQLGRLRACTDADGRARFEGLAAEPCSLHLPELHEDAWMLDADEALADSERPAPAARWSRDDPRSALPLRHVVESGECIASLGHRFGLLPDTLWMAPDNQALRGSRDDGHVLHPGDEILVPVRDTASIDVQVGRRYRLHRKGIPERLRLRLLDVAGQPRANLPYVLELEARSGTPVPSREGTTDGDGVLEEPIPPDADRGLLVLGTGREQQRLPLALGRVLPVGVTAGVQIRLVNLGYLRGPCHGILDSRTQRALEAFQHDAGLEPTGVVDDATRDALVNQHGS